MSSPNLSFTSRGRAVVAGIAGLLLAAATVQAQTILNPAVAEFAPSADHNTIVNGTPLVSRYELGFYLLGAQLPLQVQSLGKPTPGSDGRIRVALSTLSTLLSIPVLGLTYEARVSAVGPGGTRTSAASNPFSFTILPCAPRVSTTSQTVAASGGSATVGVTASCAWTAVSNASWMTITSGASGTTNGTVTYSVAANTSTSPRSGTLTVAGNVVTVTQNGTASPCTVTLASPSTTLGLAGGTGSVNVTVATTSCSWTAQSNAGWLTITSGGSGTGSGTVRFSATSMPLGLPRVGIITIGGQTFTVTQGQAPAAPATIRVNP